MYLETPKERREGRLTYIAISVIILVASTFSAALNGFFTSNILRALAKGEVLLEDPGAIFDDVKLEGAKGLGTVPTVLPVLWIVVGDALLVSTVKVFDQT